MACSFYSTKDTKKVTIQSDNLEVIKALFDNWSKVSNITVLRRVRRLLNVEGQWLLTFTPKEYNIVADHLTKLSLT